MIKLLPYIYLTFAIMLLAPSTHGQDKHYDQLTMNGITTYQQLRNDYYIGALYLESASQDPTSIINMEGKKRMDIRIIKNKWPSRLFSKQWNEAIYLNNTTETQNKFADQIREFTDIPKQKLIEGDQLLIDLDPKKGTSIYLNKQKVFQAPDAAFFYILLNTWIGPKPPSSDFKRDILTMPSGSGTSDLISRFESIRFDEKRQQQIIAWLKPTPKPQAKRKEKTKENKAASVAKSQPKPAGKTPNKPKQTTAKAKPAPVASEKAKQTVKSVTSKSKPTTNAIKQVAKTALAANKKLPTAATKEKISSAEKPLTVATATPVNTTKIATPKTKPTTDQVQKERPDEQQTKPTEAPQDTKPEQSSKTPPKAKRVYRSDIMKLTYQNTLYPKRAINLGQQGLVILEITLNRKGKIVDIKETQKTQYGLLNKAARKAVKKTSPYPPPPKSLKDEELIFELPFNFKL